MYPVCPKQGSGYWWVKWEEIKENLSFLTVELVVEPVLTSDFPSLPTSDNPLVLLWPNPKAKSLHKAQMLANNKNKAMEHRRKNPVGC